MNGFAPENYDAVEIQGVREDPVSNSIGVDNENPEFFSVYLHLKEGGVECIKDFSTLKEAQLFAADIASKHVWPLYNYTRGNHE